MTIKTTKCQPSVWLLEGIVEVKGDEYAFFYEKDLRLQDEESLEFIDQEPYDVHGFDYDYLLEYCREKVQQYIELRKRLK